MRKIGMLIAVAVVIGQTAALVLQDAEAASAGGRAAKAVVRDQFERTTNGSWGAPPGGTAWIYQPTSGSSLALSTDGHAARAACASTATQCKGIFTTGTSLAGTTFVQASFAVDSEPPAGEVNHWHVLLRHVGIRSYYSVAYYPAPVNQIRIFVADGTNVIDFADCDIALGSNLQTFSIKGRVTDVIGGDRIDGKAWVSGVAEPRKWQCSWTETTNVYPSGDTGVRLSVYAPPAVPSVDDFVVTNPTG